jgi:hypothetical protein
MYKALTIALIAFIGMTCASNVADEKPYGVKRITKPNVGVDLCPTCINVADESINILLNLILDTGILGSCQTLCQALAQKTGSEVIGTICNIACDVVGIEEFIKMIENADLDPIYYCELAKMCPVNDHGDCNVTQFSILPASGRQGTTFSIDLTYVSLNGTGTGELDIDIHCPDRIPLGASFLLEAKKPGTYTERITVKAEPDPQCDPTQQECEQWIPGTYNVTVQICNGECGSKHPHSAIYDTKRGSFQLTQ